MLKCPGLDPSSGQHEVTSFPCCGYNIYCIWKIRDPLEIFQEKNFDINDITTHFSCGHKSSHVPDARGGYSKQTCKSCRSISPGFPSSPPPFILSMKAGLPWYTVSLWSSLYSWNKESIVSFTQRIHLTSLKIQIQHYTVDHLNCRTHEHLHFERILRK